MTKKAEILKAIVRQEIKIDELSLKLEDFPDARTGFDGSKRYDQFQQLVTEELHLQSDLDALCGGAGKGSHQAFLAQELASAITRQRSSVVLDERQEKLRSIKNQIRSNLGLD